MRKLLALLLLIFITVSFSLSADSPRFIINSGHTDSVSTLDFLEKENLLFSGSYDGTIKVWDLSSGKIKYQMQISHMPIRKIELANDKPYVAAVVSDGINESNLVVWNWKTGSLLYRHRLAETPLFLLFSPKSNFLMYGKTDFDSLVFLNADDGKLLNLVPGGFGIVSSAFISNSEKTLLSYNNSGSIGYWDLLTGTSKTKISTIPNLKNISFNSSGRYMTGYTGKEILLIDLLKGSKIDAIQTEKLIQSTIDFNNDKLIWVESRNRDITINSASISASGFTNTEETTVRNSPHPTALLSTKGNIISAFNSGAIYIKKNNSNSQNLFAENELLTINDFAINENSLAITTPGKLLSISSDFFDELSRINPDAESEIINTSESSHYGISTGEGDDFLLWESESGTGGSMRIFDSLTGQIKPLTDITAPLISAEYKDGKVLSLDLNGECRIIDYTTGKDIFKYTSYGLRTVDFIDGSNIIAGRNSSSTLPSPLLHINTRTGETVSIDDSNILIFDLEYDELTRILYTLGFEERNGIMRTVLKQHTGRNHDHSETILSFAGEDINSSFKADKDSSKIFTSLGFGGVKMLYWGGFTSLEDTFSIPKALKLHGDLLATLNQDSSFTIFNPSNGSKIMDLFIFSDFSWAALLSENKYYTSEGAEKYINIYEDNSDKELDKTAYEVK